ncbi:MAG: integrase arm-type DNA-binding domain-containing protein [Pseudomonadota bacterium]
MLTKSVAKAAAAKKRAYKLHDQGGLHLLVRPTGTKSWQQKYRWRGREKLLTIGQFPEVSIARARILQSQAKERLDQGIDPSSAVQEIETLEELARAWYRASLPAWSRAHAADVIASLERDVFPELGREPAASITPPELLDACQRIADRGRRTTAHRVRQRLGEIFSFAKAKGLVTTNPASDLGAAMLSAPPAKPHPALETLEECRAFMLEIEQVKASRAAIAASNFLALTAVRWGSLRGARWREFDLENAIWTVPSARMKLSCAKKEDRRYDHIVPLSAPALAVLRSLRQKSAGVCEDPHCLVFRGRGDIELGQGALRDLYARTSFAGRHVPHGWRASFSTILNEQLGPEWRFDIDAALGHAGKGKVEAAYNRAQLLDRRRAVMGRWSELLSR